MSEFTINEETQETFKLRIQKLMTKKYRVIGHQFNSDSSLNRGTIKIFLEEDINSNQLLSFSLILPFHKLTLGAIFDVFLNELNSNEGNANTHQELGINIEKPIKENSLFT